MSAPESLAESLRTDVLDAPLSRAQAKAALGEAGVGDDPSRRPERTPLRAYPLGTRIQLVVLMVVGGVVTAMFTLGLVVAAIELVRAVAANPLVLLSPVGIGTAAVLLGIGFALRPTTSAVRRARLVQLANANGWTFTPHAYGLRELRGTLFTRGRDPAVHDVVRIRERPLLEVGELSYEEGEGRSKVTRRYGFVAMQLPQRLPHIVLDSRRNGPRGAITLSAGLAPEQYLPLEGDFDRTFRLWCPSGFERDALYLFTPDIMALFLDRAASLDVELLDGWLYLYGHPSHVNEPTPRRWRATLEIVDALAEKLDQWDRWRDDRKRPAPRRNERGAFARPAPGVSAAGARLRAPDPREVRRQRIRDAVIGLGIAVLVCSVVWGVGALTWS